MNTVQRRGIFFMRRLQNKPLKRQSNTEINFDEAVYLQAMKRFQIETRGMLPDSAPYMAVRNKIYAEMRTHKFDDEMATRKSHSGQTIGGEGSVTAEFNSFYNLLVVVPEEPDCYETVSILNYFGFPFELEEDNLFAHSRKDMGFSKDDNYPLLVMDSSSDDMPARDVAEKNPILSYLANVGLIGEFKTRSAWEGQGLEFLE